MKKYLIFSILFGLTLLSNAIPCRRIVDPTANGSFKVSRLNIVEDGQLIHLIICEKDLEYECGTCPLCATSYPPDYNPDPTDFLAMENLFSQADIKVFQNGNYSGSINATYWVTGENAPRYYQVSYYLDQSGMVIMNFDRI